MKQKASITFDDFQKVDIRIGTIVDDKAVIAAILLQRLDVCVQDADGDGGSWFCPQHPLAVQS